jgi:hypothetical protein
MLLGGVKENTPLQLILYYHINTLVLLEKCYGALQMHVILQFVSLVIASCIAQFQFFWFAEQT